MAVHRVLLSLVSVLSLLSVFHFVFRDGVTARRTAGQTLSKTQQHANHHHSASAERKKPWVIATGASSNHLPVATMVMLPSLREFVDPTNTTILFFDLGLTKQEATDLQDKFPNIEYRKFDYSAYPDYFYVTNETYAWKPVIIEQLVLEFPQSMLLWLDSGNKLRGPIDSTFAAISKSHGALTPWSGRQIGIRTHAGMFDYFGVDSKLFRDKPMASANIVGFNASDARIRNEIVQPWADCARHKECIAPKGSDRTNHRQDQSALSFLLAKNGFAIDKRAGPGQQINMAVHKDGLGQRLFDETLQ